MCGSGNADDLAESFQTVCTRSDNCGTSFWPCFLRVSRAKMNSGFPNPVLGSYPRTIPVGGSSRLRGGFKTVELEGIEPSAGISVRRDRHAIVSPKNTGQRNSLPPRSCSRWPFVFIQLWIIHQN